MGIKKHEERKLKHLSETQMPVIYNWKQCSM